MREASVKPLESWMNPYSFFQRRVVEIGIISKAFVASKRQRLALPENHFCQSPQRIEACPRMPFEEGTDSGSWSQGFPACTCMMFDAVRCGG